MDNNHRRKSLDSSHYNPEGAFKKKKFSRWMKRLIQPNHSDHTRQYIKPRPANIASDGTKGGGFKQDDTNILHENEPEWIEDNASDNFSVRGMYSVKAANLGKKQGISLSEYPKFGDEKDDQKNTFNRSDVSDKDITFEKLDTESKVSAATISTRNHPISKIDENHEFQVGESSRFSDKNSVTSDGAVSITGQETINSSLVGIPPQSILDNRRFNNTGTTHRLPITTASVASQSVKNYKLFPKTNANHQSEQYSSDNHTIVSLFSGVGTTTSHFNYFYDRNNDLRSETNSENNSLMNDRFSL